MNKLKRLDQEEFILALRKLNDSIQIMKKISDRYPLIDTHDVPQIAEMLDEDLKDTSLKLIKEIEGIVGDA